MLLYILFVIGQALRLHQIASPEWFLLDWVTVMFVLILMPGLPGLLLVFPSKVLESRIAVACQFIGCLGTLIAIAWGVLISGQWLLLAGLSIVLNFVIHRLRTARQEIV